MNEDLKNDLQITLAKAKAVAEAYSILFVDSAKLDDRVLALCASPDMQCNLYAVLEDLVYNACNMAESIQG